MIEEAILEGEIPNEHDVAFEYLLKIKDEQIVNKGKSIVICQLWGGRVYTSTSLSMK